MSRITPVCLGDFKLIVEFAQLIHQEKDEPIPVPRKDNWDMVEKCLQLPFQTVYGLQAYPGFLRKASYLFYFLIKNHPLQNGNKRLAILCLAFFCLRNGRGLYLTNSQIYELSVNTANSTDKDDAIAYIMGMLKSAIRKL